VPERFLALDVINLMCFEAENGREGCEGEVAADIVVGSSEGDAGDAGVSGGGAEDIGCGGVGEVDFEAGVGSVGLKGWRGAVGDGRRDVRCYIRVDYC
jgi:hypothetical protein